MDARDAVYFLRNQGMLQINRRNARRKLQHLCRIKSIALYISSDFRGESFYMTLTREGITYKLQLTQEPQSHDLPHQRGPSNIHNSLHVSRFIAENETLRGKALRRVPMNTGNHTF